MVADDRIIDVKCEYYETIRSSQDRSRRKPPARV